MLRMILRTGSTLLAFMDSSSTPIRRKVSVRAVSAPSSPQMPTRCRGGGRVDGHLDGPEHSGVVRVEEGLQLCVLAVQSAGVLGQIVGADGEEVALLGQLVGDEDSGGRLDHGADLQLLVELLALSRSSVRHSSSTALASCSSRRLVIMGNMMLMLP